MMVKCPCCGKEIKVVLTTAAPIAPAVPVVPDWFPPPVGMPDYTPRPAWVPPGYPGPVIVGGCCDGAPTDFRKEGAD